MDKKLIKNQPLGIKIISIIHYITAVVYFLFGLSSIIFSKSIASGIVILNRLDPSLIGTISIGIIIFSVVLMEGMAVLEFFIAKSMWRGKRWARNIVVVFAIINLIFLILMLFFTEEKIGGIILSIISILVNLVVIIYLLFNKKSREFFSKKY